jgi:hypothetical protein
MVANRMLAIKSMSMNSFLELLVFCE